MPRHPNCPPFSKENQPSPEAKSRGWDERAAKRKIRKSLVSTLDKLLSSKVVSDKMLDNVCERFNIDRGKVSHSCAVVASLLVQAENGNVKAIRELREWMAGSDQEASESQNIIIEQNIVE